ncbi:MAG: DNA adenine methylase [Candidatus Limnocylindrales bacterium]
MVPAKHKPPFPWFGGKSRVAPQIWQRFGAVRNYVDPFCGSLAMLFMRPGELVGTETVNDADGFLANFWRSVQADPEAVSRWSDWPVNENDLHARHVWLKGQRSALTYKLEGDPYFYDPQIAGWWVWGQCCWIGSCWCDESSNGPWSVVETDGVRQLVHVGNAGNGVNRKRVHLGNAGQGVSRQRVHLGDAGRGVNRELVHLGDAGSGVNRPRVTLREGAHGIHGEAVELASYFRAMSDRLRRVRVCSGDWSRVTGRAPTFQQCLTAVFLDPPYADTAKRRKKLYSKDSESVAHAVRKWALANGDNPKMRIALCGYEGEHKMPKSWDCLAWKGKGGYGSRVPDKNNANAARERIWFSPYCLPPAV